MGNWLAERFSLFGVAFQNWMMVAAAIIAWRYCIAAERKTLESVARPLAVVE